MATLTNPRKRDNYNGEDHIGVLELRNFFPPIDPRRPKRSIAQEDLVVPLSDCFNVPSTSAPTYLVDMERAVHDAMGVIESELQQEPDAAGSFRRSPLTLTGLSRSGKTTVLRSIFDVLKAKGYLVMLVSFSQESGFVWSAEATQKDMILRRVVEQLIDRTAVSDDDLRTVQCCEDVLDAYFDQQTGYATGGTVSASSTSTSTAAIPFVLLIDQLDDVGASLSSEASTMLYRLFLRKNRYLVVSSRTPVSFSLRGPPPHAASIDVRTVRLPQSTDMAELRLIRGCDTLTGHEAVRYGGIPALLSTVRSNPNLCQRHVEHVLQELATLFADKSVNHRVLMLRGFIQEVLTGKRDLGEAHLRVFDQFGCIDDHHHIWWSLCYLSEILYGLRDCSTQDVNNIIVELYHRCGRREDSLSESVVHPNVNWLTVVEMAMHLQALQAYFTKRQHRFVPFGYSVNSMKCLTMPDDVQTLAQAQQLIQTIDHALAGQMVLVRPSYPKFPLFAGFLVTTPSYRVRRVTGYQARLERLPPQEAVPSWVNGGGLILRGGLTALDVATQPPPKGWKQLTEHEIKAFVGYSLAAMYPVSWSSGVNREDMFY